MSPLTVCISNLEAFQPIPCAVCIHYIHNALCVSVLHEMNVSTNMLPASLDSPWDFTRGLKTSAILHVYNLRCACAQIIVTS